MFLLVRSAFELESTPIKSNFTSKNEIVFAFPSYPLSLALALPLFPLSIASSLSRAPSLVFSISCLLLLKVSIIMLVMMTYSCFNQEREQ